MATKSLLVNYVGYPVSPRMFVPDNGLASLAAVLLSKGHSTTILDYSAVDVMEKLFPREYAGELKLLSDKMAMEFSRNQTINKDDLDKFHVLDKKIAQSQQLRIEKIAKEISILVKELKIDFVGFKLWMGDGFEGSAIIAKQLRKDYPQLHIIGGGPQVDWFMELILDECDAFDAVAYGEGEEVIALFADYVERKVRLEDIPNLILRKNGQVIVTELNRIKDLNSLPYPVYDEGIYPSMKEDNKVKMIMIEESRGCPNSCSFCSHSKKSGKKWRMRTPEKIGEMIEQSILKYGIKTFRFTGSNPPPSLKNSIAREIIKRKLKIRYSVFDHIRPVSFDELKLLKDSGCNAVFLGVESGSQEILDKIMNKKIKVDLIGKTIALFKEAGIHIVTSFIVPAPMENEKTKKETMELLLKSRPDSVLVGTPALISGTDWAENREKYGFAVNDFKLYWKRAMRYTMKPFYPPFFWEEMPDYVLNGKPFRSLMLETASFVNTLERNGLLTHITDELFIMSEKLPIPFKEFRDKSREYIFTGNFKDMGLLVKRINEGLQV